VFYLIYNIYKINQGDYVKYKDCFKSSFTKIKDGFFNKKHKNIRIMDDKYIYVRFTFNRHRYSKAYMIKEWSSKYTALEAALNYRDSLICVLKFAKKNKLDIKGW